jgi:hypothetical protein
MQNWTKLLENYGNELEYVSCSKAPVIGPRAIIGVDKSGRIAMFLQQEDEENNWSIQIFAFNDTTKEQFASLAKLFEKHSK